ncbi:hypothetical protein K501DRAFT_239179 [Backusella circina FSU 941]|nr:hypothetical protein K501DRAFT_239179 [Backusella circina FSU 941]
MLSARVAPEESTVNHSHLVPWLRKKESSWSVLSHKKQKPITLTPSYSTLSLALSDTSTLNDTELPPIYDDKSHPWVYSLPSYLAERSVVPREEEGYEILPDYDCTIDQTFYTYVKCEFSQPNIKAKSRSWRYYYVQIYGTMMMAFQHDPKQKKKATPVWKYSMCGAEVKVASDYIKYRHVIRLKLHDGPQFLLRTRNDKQSNEWISYIETSANISSDLDDRKMPTFITLPASRRRRQQQASSS